MKFCFYTLLVGISSLISCVGTTDSQYPRYTTFPSKERLTTQEISLDTILFRYPFRITIQDSIAIIMDLHNPDHFFHAFRYPDWKYLTSFGKRGEAPDEMLLAVAFQMHSHDSIWALDANKMQLTRWSISPSECTIKREEAIALDKSLIRTLDFRLTTDGIYVPNYLGECRYQEIGFNGKPIKNIGKIPTETYTEDDIKPALAQSWRSFMDYNPENGILVFVTQLGEAIEIYNTKENTHYVLYGPNGEPKFKKDSQGESIPTEEGIMGFCDVVVTNHYIYAPFRGISFREIKEAYKQGKEAENGAYSIYVFDLKGNPVCEYTLDQAINGISVNETTGIITATCVKSDEPIVEIKI